MPHSDDLRYQVFVSSTFRDLQEERQKVLQAILELQAFPAGMELFPAADDDQFHFIKREILSSDYYLVIVAGKYGSVASDGLSFTEKEYDYAVDIGKPIITFLFHDLNELKGAHLEETAKAKQSLEAFRNKVKSGRLVKFYKNPDDLKAGVLQALVNAFRLKPGRGWVRAENASRLEDLKEINELRKRLGVLEAENTSLKIAAADPRTLLAQGSELASWTVQWVSNDGGSLVSHNLLLSFTWDELLAGCFDIHNFPAAHPTNITNGIQRLVRMKAEQAVSSEGLPSGTLNQDGAGLRVMINEIKQQFLGLGYIDIDDRERIEWWVLTLEGRVRVTLLRGKRRMPD